MTGNFNNQESKQLELFLLLKNQHFSYFIHSPNESRTLAFHSPEFPFALDDPKAIPAIRDLFKEDPNLQLSYKAVHISLFSPYFTIIPGNPESSNLLKDLLGTNTSLPAHTRIDSSWSQKHNYSLIYGSPGELISHLKQWFAYTSLQHSALPMLDYLIDRSENSPNPLVYANVHPGYLEIIVVENGRFRFYNAFEYKNQDDFIYFLLMVWDKLELCREETPLILAGNIDTGSVFYKACYSYIHKIKFASRPALRNFAPEVSKLPEHDHFNLFCIS